jgi:hypothetical protein
MAAAALSDARLVRRAARIPEIHRMMGAWRN